MDSQTELSELTKATQRKNYLFYFGCTAVFGLLIPAAGLLLAFLAQRLDLGFTRAQLRGLYVVAGFVVLLQVLFFLGALIPPYAEVSPG